MKLAIVEDEVILAMALTLMLEDWGHQVVGTADSEAAALALVESERPDAVLMDIRLGRKDSGLRAARILRETTDIPIVFCTAYADSLAIQAEVRRKRWLEPRLAGLAFERVQHRGFFAADVSAGADEGVNVEIDAGALDVLAEQSGRIRFLQSRLEARNRPEAAPCGRRYSVLPSK